MKKRIENVCRYIVEKGWEAVLVEDPIDLYYLTGIQLSVGKLLISGSTATLFVDARYEELCREANPCEVVLAKRNGYSCLKSHLAVGSLIFDSGQLIVRDYLALKELCEKKQVALRGIEQPLMALRQCKDADELSLLRQAAALGSAGYDFLCEQLKEGVTEIELVRALRFFWLEQGGDGLAFDPIIAFGSHTSMPHYHPGETRLKHGDPVLIDIGVTHRHYQSDMTRVVFFGEPDPKMREIYEVVKGAQEAALKLARAGTPIMDLDKAAREWIETHGYGEYFTHGLGHGVGLDVHEPPTIRKSKDAGPLEKGMVITIEPGVYLPGFGGVRIENSIIIEEAGYEDLTKRDTEIKVI